MKCTVRLIWDAEAGVWLGMSDDIPGLVLESNSIEVLMERIKWEAPEFLETNCNYCGPAQLTFIMEHVVMLEEAV